MSLPNIRRKGIEFRSVPTLSHVDATELVETLASGEIDYAVIRGVVLSYDQLHGAVTASEPLHTLYRAALERELGRVLGIEEKVGTYHQEFNRPKTDKHVDFPANAKLLVTRLFFNAVTAGTRSWDLYEPKPIEDMAELEEDARTLDPYKFGIKYYDAAPYDTVALRGPSVAVSGNVSAPHDVIMLRGGVGRATEEGGMPTMPTCHGVFGEIGSSSLGLFVARAF